MDPDVTYLVLDFLNGDGDIDVLNETFLVCIPKVKNLKLVFDCRPISLCNVVYKIIFKMLSNRLRMVIQEVVDEA